MNRLLGQLGEKFAVEVERRRLLSSGRDDLAAKVEWVAMTCGDGLGFDVLSFHEATRPSSSIEVKTTGLGKHFPFYVTANEVRCSEDCPDRFRLYRVFDFARIRGSTWSAGRWRESAGWSRWRTGPRSDRRQALPLFSLLICMARAYSFEKSKPTSCPGVDDPEGRVHQADHVEAAVNARAGFVTGTSVP